MTKSEIAIDVMFMFVTVRGVLITLCCLLLMRDPAVGPCYETPQAY